jgi:hypothetical protein
MTPPGAHFVSAADFKSPQRAAIEAEGYTIVANIGDQPSDLAGGHSQQTFLLPDPFYRIPGRNCRIACRWPTFGVK